MYYNLYAGHLIRIVLRTKLLLLKPQKAWEYVEKSYSSVELELYEVNR